MSGSSSGCTGCWGLSSSTGNLSCPAGTQNSTGACLPSNACWRRTLCSRRTCSLCPKSRTWLRTLRWMSNNRLCQCKAHLRNQGSSVGHCSSISRRTWSRKWNSMLSRCKARARNHNSFAGHCSCTCWRRQCIALHCRSNSRKQPAGRHSCSRFSCPIWRL